MRDTKQIIIPVLYIMTSCHFQDVQGPKWSSRTFHGLEIWWRKFWDF